MRVNAGGLLFGQLLCLPVDQPPLSLTGQKSPAEMFQGQVGNSQCETLGNGGPVSHWSAHVLCGEGGQLLLSLS